MIVFDRKDPKTLIQDYFCPKTENEKNAVFWPKSQVNPFGKSGKMQLPEVNIFIGSKQFFFIRLRVVPHFSPGIVEQAKRERARKSPHARKYS